MNHHFISIIKDRHSLYKALNNKRYQIVMVSIAQHGSISVTDLYLTLRMEQPVCSQILRGLRKVGLVQTNKIGKNVFYSLTELAHQFLMPIRKIDNQNIINSPK